MPVPDTTADLYRLYLAGPLVPAAGGDGRAGLSRQGLHRPLLQPHQPHDQPGHADTGGKAWVYGDYL